MWGLTVCRECLLRKLRRRAARCVVHRSGGPSLPGCGNRSRWYRAAHRTAAVRCPARSSRNDVLTIGHPHPSRGWSWPHRHSGESNARSIELLYYYDRRTRPTTNPARPTCRFRTGVWSFDDLGL